MNTIHKCGICGKVLDYIFVISLYKRVSGKDERFELKLIDSGHLNCIKNKHSSFIRKSGYYISSNIDSDLKAFK